MPGGVLCAYCVAWRDAYSGQQAASHEKLKKQIKFSKSPPPQTKTLKTKRVFLYSAALLFQCEEGEEKLCGEFKFSYIGRTGRENFCSVVSFVLLRRFELMYIYANRKELRDRVLMGGFSVGVAVLALFNV